MPCFRGLAVSIHTPDGPIAEHSIQRLQRQSRITSYIAVPPPKIHADSLVPEQSTFAISITLLTPGLAVPYSAPKPTLENPWPQPQIVGGLPGAVGERGKYGSTVAPYIPILQSPNETIAAYIYFDGRAKEEVATLLRRGEETWVNSRWVSVPESEGGGLAEREFLFREVGLERWLNGLDLEGEQQEVAAKLARRKQRLEKKRRKRSEVKVESDEEDKEEPLARARPVERNQVLRYGNNESSPVEALSADDIAFPSDSSSEDEPMPESSGQIKVCLFRVLASGEIKRGEYSPQFDAHDDDDGMEQNGSSGNNAADADHTTSFAKPKTLDPKSISTQTVTGLDPSERPYATFTFLYRGEKQLQKMGILPTPEPSDHKPSSSAKRKSKQLDFSTLPPLKPKNATAGFTGYREGADSKAGPKNGAKKDVDDMDSDNEGGEDASSSKRKLNGLSQEDDGDTQIDDSKTHLSPEDSARRGELAEGVKKLQLKRQHSAEPLAPPISIKSPTIGTDIEGGTANRPSGLHVTTTPSPTDTSLAIKKEDAFDIGSPFKKHRASVAGFPGDDLGNLGAARALSRNIEEAVSDGGEGNVGVSAAMKTPNLPKSKDIDGDEEL